MDLEIFKALEYVLVSVLLTGILAFPIIYLLYKFNIVRQIEVDFSTLIESRKSKLGTPIMGGLMVISSVLIINLIANFTPRTDIALVIFACAAFLGGLDDLLNIFGSKRKVRPVSRIIKLIRVHKVLWIRLKYILGFPWYVYKQFVNAFQSNPGSGLLAHEKFFIQLVLGAVLGVWTYHTQGGEVWVPFLGSLNLGILIIPIAVFLLALMTNAVNISDGLDGLSAGMLHISFAGLALVALIGGNHDLLILISTIVGALTTYMYFNVPPARVQMGDVGSFALGAILTTMFFALDKVLLLPFIGLPFIIEVASTIVQSVARRVFGRRILAMAPLHHHFEMQGWSEEKVVIRFWLFTICSTIFGVWLCFF